MVAVVTDSAANIPGDLAARLGIEVVPMYLRIDGAEYRDGAEPGEVYARVAASSGAASTATPAPGDFLAAFERAGSPEIVCVTVSARVSGIFNAASVAAGQFGGRVEVIDSGNASMAEGFVALAAAREARSGAGIDGVMARAHDVAGRAGLIATIDTFEYLRRSGRVNALLSFAGQALGIKPVFRFRGGEISGVGRPRTRRRALDRVLAEALADIAGRPARVAAVHAAAEAEAGDLLERVRERVEVVEALLTGFTPAMGVHTGPGVVGLAYAVE